ncbi:zymogen granule membrane protein 16-like [Xyrichtys novacula]|uniref:Zymogen granule membrane protein 16-like n=1 Tax=Xyrichtys novacula TaxID=13765 RepID=A0AAV1HBK5_XYRNO|nr:zymogen granule membrane protein 16-like [Xyrichtys novacula]
MFCIVLVTLLSACVLADVQPSYYSFSPSVGSGSGTSYSLTGEGRITAIRVWEVYSKYIYGFQLRYGHEWSLIAGKKVGDAQEMELFDNEAIIQVSGKYTSYLQSVVFITNRGRSLWAGQPAGRSFNMYPTHSVAELRFLSGRYTSVITSFQAHWGLVAST